MEHPIQMHDGIVRGTLILGFPFGRDITNDSTPATSRHPPGIPALCAQFKVCLSVVPCFSDNADIFHPTPQGASIQKKCEFGDIQLSNLDPAPSLTITLSLIFLKNPHRSAVISPP